MSSDKHVRFFNPGLGYSKLKEEILPEIDRVLTNGDLILRDDVEKFEKSVAEYVGTKYAVALNSCTDALYLALRGLGIGPGDKVLVPSRTFVASVQVIVQVGATPVYYDVNDKVSNIKWDEIKAIIPVHIEGALDRTMWSNMTALKAWCHGKGIYMIEDAAQAFGAYEIVSGTVAKEEEIGNKKMAGSFGIAGCFSFYPAKTLGAYGDAGALVTNDEKLYEYVKEARNHFKNDARDWGVNSRLDNLQAAILNVKFKYYPQALERRAEVAGKYHFALQGIEGLILPSAIEGRIWQDYIVRTEKRDGLFTFLKENGVETMKNNYPFPVPKLPLAQKYEDETLRLPCNELLTDSEIEYTISSIKEFFNV